MSIYTDAAAARGESLIPWENDDLATDAIGAFYMIARGALEAGGRDGAPMIMDVHLLDRPNFGAMALSYPDADVIAINKNVFSILLSCSRALISHGLIFPEHKTEGLDVIPCRSGIEASDIARGNDIFNCEQLNDPIRDVLADTLYRYASIIMLGHEMAHIYNGHIGWLNEKRKVATQESIDNPSFNNHRAWQKETLEWDADCTSLNEILQLVLSPKVTTVGGRSVWELNFAFDDERTVLQIQLVLASALLVNMLTYVQLDRDYDDPNPGSHPPPIMRVFYSAEIVMHAIEYRTGQKLDSHFEKYVSFIEPFMSSWAEVFAPRRFPPRNIDPDEVMNLLEVRLERWGACWAEIRDELEAHRRGTGALAPKTPTTHPAFPDSDTLG